MNNKILDLVNDLIDATYNTGWTAGAIEQGRTDLNQVQKAEIEMRDRCKKRLLLQLDAVSDKRECNPLEHNFAPFHPGRDILICTKCGTAKRLWI